MAVNVVGRSMVTGSGTRVRSSVLAAMYRSGGCRAGHDFVANDRGPRDNGWPEIEAADMVSLERMADAIALLDPSCNRGSVAYRCYR